MEELEKRVRDLERTLEVLLEELGYEPDYIPEEIKLIKLND